MGTFSLFNFYCWCVLHSEHNEFVVFLISSFRARGCIVDGRQSIWCGFCVASVHVHAAGR